MASFDSLDKYMKYSPSASLFKSHSPLYDEAIGDTKKMEKEAKQMQAKQKEFIQRQKLMEKRRKDESDSDISLRKARMQGKQFGRRSLLGG